jgi:hypothetical protein
MKSKIVAALGGLGISLVALTASSAIDRYPAGQCFAEGSTSLSKLNYDGDRVNNASGSGTASVMCPIRTNIDGTVETTAYLHYYDNSSSQNLTCTHFWSDFDGVYWSWGFTSSGQPEGEVFEVTDTDITFLFKNWRCVLPPSNTVFIQGYDYYH